MEDVIYTIDPIETPFVDLFSLAQQTIIRFSGYDVSVCKYFRRMNKRRAPRVRHEWILDTLPHSLKE